MIKKPSLSDIYYNHIGHVSDKWEQYLEVYDNAFHKYIGKNPISLEIGVQNGGSLQISSKYFINGNIYGIDINPDVCKMSLGNNITTYCFDAKDKQRFEYYFNNTVFDTILDDASHINSDIILTFRNLFPHVKPGGVYAIEDLHTSYWMAYGGGYLKQYSAIEYLKKFIDLLHAHHINNDMVATHDNNEFINNLSIEDRYVFEWLESVSFHDSIAVIRKLTAPRTKSFKRISTGDECPINCIVKQNYNQKNHNESQEDQILYSSIIQNNITSIKEVLLTDVNINHIHSIGATALYMAIEKNYTDIAEYLINEKADVNIKTIHGVAPLYKAIEINNYKLAKLLIENRADIETAIKTGSTPLYVAAFYGFKDLVELLLEKGAQKNITVLGIDTLHRAINNKHYSTALLLADNEENFCEEIPLDVAEGEYIDICGKFIEIVDEF
ncbi:MAG: ankyrin repeat domain-containing protein [Pseudomonadota bacterium]